MTTPEKLYSLLKQAQALQSRYHVVEVTDLRSGIKSYKIYRRGTAGKSPPVASGLPTLADAEAKMHELEAKEANKL